jgi:hypothetical protein
MIDIQYIRQSYERREISEILWIKGDENPADAMTKEKTSRHGSNDSYGTGMTYGDDMTQFELSRTHDCMRAHGVLSF